MEVEEASPKNDNDLAAMVSVISLLQVLGLLLCSPLNGEIFYDHTHDEIPGPNMQQLLPELLPQPSLAPHQVP